MSESTSRTRRATPGSGLGSLWQRSGKLVERVTDSVKEAARSGLLKQGIEARERGNLGAAYFLLKEEFGNRPEESEVAVAFWDAACEYDRAADAAPAVAGLIKRHAQIGQQDLAAQYWIELTSRVEGAMADPAALVRVIPTLQELVHAAEAELREADSEDGEVDEEIARAKDMRHAALMRALQSAASPDNGGLTPGLAIHLAELARDLDPESALSAARTALGSEELHETKRRRMVELMAEIDPSAALPFQSDDEPEAEAFAPEPQPDLDAEPQPAEPQPDLDAAPEPVTEQDPARNHPLRTDSPPRDALSDEELEALRKRLPPSRSSTEGSTASESTDAPAPAAPDGSDGSHRDLMVHHGRLSALGEAMAVVALEDGRRARVAFEKLEAIAVAEVEGLERAPVVIIDLLLNWRTGPDAGQPLRGVRLRLTSLDDTVALEKPEGTTLTGRELLSELLDRAPAAPLPGPDAALGGPIPRFESPADYERDVLGLRRPC